MTRINVGIPVESLTDEHLLAEHYEVERFPWYFSKFKGKIPEKFTLGTGHISFFMDKMGYVRNRYQEVHQECLNRGFNVKDRSNLWNEIPESCMKDYNPGSDDQKILIERISNRISSSRKEKFHYCGHPITKDLAFSFLKKKLLLKIKIR